MNDDWLMEERIYCPSMNSFSCWVEIKGFEQPAIVPDYKKCSARVTNTYHSYSYVSAW